MKVTWTVTPTGYQGIAKRCPSCNVKRDFMPSGAFRINSQKKMLDVWSIYKCTHCEYTWNIALFSRLPVSRINHELYNRLLTNDADTVQYFAHDKTVLYQNNAELSGYPTFSVTERWHTTMTIHQQVIVTVKLSRSFQVSLLSILKKQLSLSSTQIKKLLDSGDICGVTMKLLKSKKLNSGEYTFLVSVETMYARRILNLNRR